MGGELTEDEKLYLLDYKVYVKGIWFNAKEEQVNDFFVKNGCADVIQMCLARYL